MELVYLVILLLLIEYFAFAGLVGRARGQHKIDAPATTGHPDFERRFRVHANTAEQLIMVIPALVLFGMYVDARWAAGLGVAFMVARLLYFRDYVHEPKMRGRGFGTGMFITGVLVVGSLWGIGSKLLH